MSLLTNKYFILCCLAAALLCAFGLTQTGTSDRSTTLIVGLQSGYPPFEFRDQQGNLTGFDVELSTLIAKKLGKQVVFQDMDFEGIILSLKQDEIDLAVSGMNITPSRSKEITMLPYKGEKSTSLMLIFWDEIPAHIHALADVMQIPNAVISVESGAIPEMIVKKHYPELKIKSLPSALDPLMDVKYGKSLANLVEVDVAHYHKKKYPSIHLLEVPLPPGEVIEGFGIGIKKENSALAQDVTRVLAELKASGELQALDDHWFKGGH